MKLLLSGGTVVNVFTDELIRTNVLIGGDTILGVGDYSESDADAVCDVSGKWICPGFTDGHIHIESTLLTPAELTKAALPHGTTAIVADPHEIANVAGTVGIRFMLEMSEGLPMQVYIMLPSCVPAMPLDESGAELLAADLEPLYAHPRVLGLAEVMNYPGVIAGADYVMDKIRAAKAAGRIIDGHAPLLTGKALDCYLAAGIESDHECSTFAEALERVQKGQWVMIRQGTAARNLDALLPLFAEPYSRRCLLVTDDKHPEELLRDGHIDAIIRRAVQHGRSPLTGIRMATLQAAQYFGLRGQGAVAPGYRADLLVLDSLEEVRVGRVFAAGRLAAENGICREFAAPVYSDSVRWDRVLHSFRLRQLSAADFHITPQPGKCRVIGLIPGQLLTEELHETLDLSGSGNGIDLSRDILKLAVIERHGRTGHRGLGFIRGIGLKSGAIAGSVSHDSHNLIVIGTNDADMAAAANRILENGGGFVCTENGKVAAELPLPVAGLMSSADAKTVAEQNDALNLAVHARGVPEAVAPFMNMAFVSLTVIPHIKMTTHGLCDVDTQTLLPLFTEEQT